MSECIDQYAESVKRDLGSLFHHVHPRVLGHAHCDRRIKLIMSGVKSAPPEDMRFCERCQRILERNIFLHSSKVKS